MAESRAKGKLPSGGPLFTKNETGGVDDASGASSARSLRLAQVYGRKRRQGGGKLGLNRGGDRTHM